jgi:hypothetical protein
MIGIVLPTVTGREASLERCVESYERNTTAPYRMLVLKDRDTCGAAWIEGADTLSDCDFLHFAADDLEAHEGWDQTAIETVQQNALPAPVVLNGDGTLQSAGGDMSIPGSMIERLQPDGAPVDYSGIPFLTREMYDQIGAVPIHYCSDTYISYVGRELGFETILRHGYRFTHWFEQPGRGAGMSQNERLVADNLTFKRYLRERFPAGPQRSRVS